MNVLKAFLFVHSPFVLQSDAYCQCRSVTQQFV